MADGDLSGPAGAAMPAMTLRANGFPLTPRMKAMGIVGLQFVPGGAAAEFASCPGALHTLPQPVLDYLLASGPEPLAGPMIDRAARSLFDDEHDTPSIVWEDADDEEKEAWRESVRTVLRAIREPDEGMIDEGYASYDANGGSIRDVFMDMIDAALGDG